MNTSIDRHFGIIGAAFFTFALVLAFGVTAAHANPSFFAPKAVTATATTSPAYMTPGTATSTLVYDSFNLNGTNQSSPSDPTAADSVTLAVQFTASSTSSVLGIAIERSDDGVDWYQDNLSALSTTTPTSNVSLPVAYTWTFASSTLNGVVNTGNRVGKVLNIATPTRYTRAVFTNTGASAAVWGQFIPKKQNK